MFKFGFDLPPEQGDDGAGVDADLQPQQEAPSDAAANEALTRQDASTSSTTSNKPQLSVLDMSNAIAAVFESDTLFEYVPLLGGGDGAVEESAAGAAAAAAGAAIHASSASQTIQPLRRVVFPPDQKVPPSLSGDAAAVGSSVLNKESLADSDLIPGVYEGGLKVWECSLDLCRHLAQEIVRLDLEQPRSEAAGGNNDEENNDDDTWKSNDVYHALSRTGKTMELGCGHGLPACLVLRELRKRWGDDDRNCSKNAGEGEYSVLFSDYNEFVLRDATVPNIILNMDGDRPCPNDADEWGKVKSCVACVAGDWMDLSNRLQAGSISASSDALNDSFVTSLPDDGRFDLILAAETTYTEESSKDTAELLARHLKVNEGVGLVATKRYYFGVGGGADAFRQAASSMAVGVGQSGEQIECQLKVETVKSYDSGVGRDLLRVRLVVT